MRAKYDANRGDRFVGKIGGRRRRLRRRRLTAVGPVIKSLSTKTASVCGIDANEMDGYGENVHSRPELSMFCDGMNDFAH